LMCCCCPSTRCVLKPCRVMSGNAFWLFHFKLGAFSFVVTMQVHDRAAAARCQAAHPKRLAKCGNGDFRKPRSKRSAWFLFLPDVLLTLNRLMNASRIVTLAVPNDRQCLRRSWSAIVRLRSRLPLTRFNCQEETRERDRESHRARRSSLSEVSSSGRSAFRRRRH